MIPRLLAFLDYLRARRDMVRHTVAAFRARRSHIRSGPHMAHAEKAYHRMVKARRVMREGRAW